MLAPREGDALSGRSGPAVRRDDADPERAWAKIAKSRAPIGQLVMDQAVMSGLGNIYRTEILWRQRHPPQTPRGAGPPPPVDAVWGG